MPQQIKMSDVRRQFPMYDKVDDEQLLEAVRQRFYPTIAPEQFGTLVERDTERRAQLTPEWRRNTMRSMAGATAQDSSWARNALVNIGAGAQELVTGAQQRWNDLFGNDQRGAALQQRAGDERAVAEAFAANTKGGGALQVAGNVLPTLAVPVGTFANAGVRGATFLPRAFQALRAGRPMAAAPTVGTRLGTGGLVADSALAGGVYGALAPTVEGESTFQNALQGAAGGALFPTVVGIGNAGRRMMTASGGGERAAEQIAAEVAGAGVTQAERQAALGRTLQALRDNQAARVGPPRPNTANVPLSTAAQLDSAELARLERGSRARNAGNWYEFDQGQARAVADEFGTATSEAQQLGARRATRSQAWDQGWSATERAIDPAAFRQEVRNLSSTIDEALLTPDAANPAVRNMLNDIASELQRYGDKIQPGVLQQMRANLNGRMQPLSPNAYKAAPRDAAATRRVIGELDRILGDASGGRWQGVLGDYAANSRLVDQAKAAGRVREAFYDPATGRVLGVAADAAGDVPKITEAGLGRAMNRGRDPAQRSLLSQPAETRMQSVLEALRRQGITQRVARTATAGGGSNTASDLFAAEAAGQAADALAGAAGAVGGAPAVSATRAALGALQSLGATERDRALAEALQDPRRMLELLEALERSGRPLTTEQSVLLNALRSSGAAVAQ
jgi:hypothetical protein